MADDKTIEEILSQFGEVTSAEVAAHLEMPYFENIDVVAGFPVGGGDTKYPSTVEVVSMLCPAGSQSYFVKVKGDSMVDAEIYDGDLAVIDASVFSRRGPDDILLCEVNGEYTIKRVVQRGGRTFLVPSNPNFPDIEVDANELKIWGRVSYVIHKV